MYHHHQACLRCRREYSTVRTGREAVPHKISNNITLAFHISPAFTQAHPTNSWTFSFPSRTPTTSGSFSTSRHELSRDGFLTRKRWLGNTGHDSFKRLRHLPFEPQHSAWLLAGECGGQRFDLGSEDMETASLTNTSTTRRAFRESFIFTTFPPFGHETTTKKNELTITFRKLARLPSFSLLFYFSA